MSLPSVKYLPEGSDISVDVDADVAPFRRILHGVLQQIAEDLLEAVAIAVDDALTAVDVDAEVPVAERGVMAVHDVAHEVRPWNRFAADLQASGLDARHVEELENQPRHAVDLIECDVEVLLRGRQIVFANERLRQ